MNNGKYVFSQLIELISHKSFQTCVNRYNGEHKVKHFSCWRQFLCMIFGQLTHRESLTDTMICLKANAAKLYHLGIGTLVSKSTLSKANENRDWRIFADLTLLLIAEAKSLYLNDSDLEVELKNNVFAIDATTIDLCLSAFSWANFRKAKGGIKIHTQLDLKTAIPEFIHISTAKVHELNFLDMITYIPESIYVLDRGYIDFARLYRIHQCGSYFIVRARDRMDFKRIHSHAYNKKEGVYSDQTVRLNNYFPAKKYPEKLRRIKFFDQENNRMLIFLTNNFELLPTDIAQLYKHRWKIELFFKWIKQHLKIKSFWGRSSNAVKTQIWIAIGTYTLVAIAKKKFMLKQSLYEILQILSISIFDKTPVNQLFQTSINQNVKELNCNQLNIFE